MKDTRKHEQKPSQKNTMLKIASYTILLLIIVAFIGGPLITFFTPTPQANEFGSYAGNSILYDPMNYFGRSTQSQIEYYRQQFNDRNFIDSMGRVAMRGAFDQTVEVFALLDIAQVNSYYVSNEKINKIISEIPDLQTEGKFDIELYKLIPKETRLKLLEVQRQIELSGTIRNDLLEQEFISENEQRFLNHLNNDRRLLHYIVLEHANVKDKSILTEFAEQNLDFFTLYEFKSLTVADEEEAKTIRARIVNGESSFEEEVESYSIDSGKEDQGERGSLYAYEISEDESEEALEAIKNLEEETGVSEVIRNNEGNFAMYMRTTEPDPLDMEDEESLDVVQKYLNAYDPKYIEEKIQAEAERFIESAREETFADAAAAFDYSIYRTNYFPINIGSVTVFDKVEEEGRQEEQSIPINFLSDEETMLEELFALEKKAISKYYTVGNRSYVFFVDELQPPPELSDIGVEEGDINRIAAFLRTYKNNLLKNFVVDEKKLKDNFVNAYEASFPQTEQN